MIALNQYLLGIDNGGTMTKAAIFTLDGKMVSSASRRTPLMIPKEGYAERDMTLLWEASCGVIRESAQKAGAKACEIIGIGCTGHGKGLYPWGKDGRPAYHAIASTDSRAAGYVEKWRVAGVAALARQKTLQPVLACQPAALLAWLKDHEPASYGDIRWIFEAKDYIRFMLTGEAYAETTDYSGTNLMNLLTRRFDRGLLGLFGIDDIYDKLPPLVSSCEPCGKVTKAAAEATGLAEGTPVCGGMFDIDACAIATDISDEKSLCVVTGTWSINEYISRKPVDSVTTMNSLFCIPGYYLIEESSPTSAGNLEWFISNFLGRETAQAEAQGVSVYRYADRAVESVAPGESEILFLPFLYGTNNEHCSASAFYGMNASQDKRHLLRAVFEGVVFSHMQHIDRLLAHREKPPVLRLSGGAANSPVWVRMFADATDIPVEVVKVRELGALGCTMAAAVSAGVYSDYRQAAKSMVNVSEAVKPDPDAHLIYQKKYGHYQELIRRLSNFKCD